MLNNPINYSQAKLISESINKRVDITSNALNSKYTQKTSIGTIPDSIRQTIQYKTDKLAFDTAFNELKSFNKIYVKTFKKEIRAERLNKYQLNTHN